MSGYTTSLSPITGVELRPATRLQQLGAMRIACPSETVFVLVISTLWALFYNPILWRQTVSVLWLEPFGSALFLGSLAVLVIALQAVLLLLAPTLRALRIWASVLFLTAAIGSYFVEAYGALLNKDMLRNVVQTDVAEVGGLLGWGLVLHVLGYGILPALLVWRVSLPTIDRKIRLRQRALFTTGALALCLVALLSSSANYAVFFREHKSIRYSLVPLTPVASAVSLGAETWKSRRGKTLVDLSGEVRRVGPTTAAVGIVADASRKPLVLFIVVGETARAANFRLGGYSRQTNPRLSAVDDLVYFDRATSCGTSTAVSVPCMFSHAGRARFDVGAARGYTNLLDSLVKAGFDVQWRDNNAGCKGVCARIPRIDYTPARNGGQHCPNSYCYDAVMLADLDVTLRSIKKDTAIVFHQIGSHGPAYAERYPAEFEVFKPACRTNQLQSCTQEELVNAYDNTILYTDYIVSQQIALLRAAEDRVESMLLYVSDHGESLGEGGIYLHGMPYSFAPDTQKQVPFMIWTSHGYARHVGLNTRCLRAAAHAAVSHDNIYHTILGAALVRNALYDSSLDLIGNCHTK